ncbi:MAG: glycosyltransferase [Patescibacteria group bacterium]
MRIAIATPLYPPDIAEPAPYVKELAARLSGKHEITIVTYGRFPEEIPGVRIVAVSKQRPLPIRLALYTFALLSVGSRTDVIYALNGPSVELPASIASFLTRTPLIAFLGDASAHARAQQRSALKHLEETFLRRACTTVSHTPLQHPEILPFSPYPNEKMEAFNRSWKAHLEELEAALLYV